MRAYAASATRRQQRQVIRPPGIGIEPACVRPTFGGAGARAGQVALHQTGSGEVGQDVGPSIGHLAPSLGDLRCLPQMLLGRIDQTDGQLGIGERRERGDGRPSRCSLQFQCPAPGGHRRFDIVARAEDRCLDNDEQGPDRHRPRRILDDPCQLEDGLCLLGLAADRRGFCGGAQRPVLTTAQADVRIVLSRLLKQVEAPAEIGMLGQGGGSHQQITQHSRAQVRAVRELDHSRGKEHPLGGRQIQALPREADRRLGTIASTVSPGNQPFSVDRAKAAMAPARRSRPCCVSPLAFSSSSARARGASSSR